MVMGERAKPEPVLAHVHPPVVAPHSPADRHGQESTAAQCTTRRAALSAEVRPGRSNAPLDLIVVVPDEGVALVVIESESLREPPGCALLQV